MNPPVYHFECVWMTTNVTGTPHAAALQAANPELRVHTCYSPQGETPEDSRHRWRNCDRNIRGWWDENRAEVATDQVLFLEWDVFANVNLPDHLPSLGGNYGIAGPRILSPISDRAFWPFQEDLPKLPREMEALACATAPLAVLLISRAALDAIQAPCYDAIFADDIFCETRLPTVIRHAGFRVVEMRLPDVGCKPMIPGPARGIYHPVKQPVYLSS